MSTARRGRSGGLLRSDRLVRMGRLAVPAVASWLGARTVVSLAFLLAHGLSGHLHHTLAAAGGSGAFTTHDRLAQGLLGWDASWYSAIAAHGYAGVGHASLRFFPLTPMAAWIVGGLLGIGPGDGLLVVANAAALVAGILVARLAWRELGDGPTGRRATWLLSLSPAAFVLAMGYAEPLFLALAAGVFLAVRPKRQQGHGTQHWWVAAVLGFMAGLARPQGVLLSLGVAVEAWREIRARKAGLLGREPGAGAGDSVAAPAGFPAVRTPAMAAGPALAPWRSNAGPIVATLAPLAGGGSYLLWVAWRYGGLFTPLSIQTSAARRGGFADPVATLARDVGDLVSFHHVRQMVKFSRETLFTRDSFCCQYCGKRFDKHDLTFDHVLPAARGGPKTWENIVTACRKCNHRKSGKTPEEAGMKLLKKAERPHWSPAILVMMNLNCRGPKVWENYLYDASRTVFSQTVEPHM